MTKERKAELRAAVESQCVASGELAEALDYIDELEAELLAACTPVRHPVALQDQIDRSTPRLRRT
jgi:hypothetical protein